MTQRPQLQTNSRTYVGRHWQEHSVVSRMVADSRETRILSFGCSTGEELMTLRLLFPNARLFGCDIDWSALQKARSLNGANAEIFFSSDEAIECSGPFDLIVCNSVLLSHTTVKNGVRSGVDPNLWLDTIAMLDKSLAPGGVLQIVNSNIPFRLHPCAANYSAEKSNLLLGCNFVDMFDLENRHLCTGVPGVGWSCHLPQHLAEEYSSLLKPVDLDVFHWRKEGNGRTFSAPQDEIIPNMPRGKVLATGSSSYQPTPPANSSKPRTYVQVSSVWEALTVDCVRITRTHSRVWFDDIPVSESVTTVDLVGPEATVFLESVSGRRSSRLAFDAMFNAAPVRAPSI
jgi:hypothetical protein